MSPSPAFPVVHPRVHKVTDARLEFEEFFSKLRDKYELTTSEQLFILTYVAHDLLGLCVRAEREEEKTCSHPEEACEGVCVDSQAGQLIDITWCSLCGAYKDATDEPDAGWEIPCPERGEEKDDDAP